jgi:nitroreductase
LPAALEAHRDHHLDRARAGVDMNGHRIRATTVRRVVELATRAPSVHNTQPWRWLWTGETLELHADRDRQLHADPEGRNLVISCGAALHHAEVAADSCGWATTVARYPEPDGPDLLARLTFAPAHASETAAEAVEAIERRCTDRRRFTSWPVPAERLTRLAAVAKSRGARALPLVDASERYHAELLISRAIDRQKADAAVTAEEVSWVDHSAHDGIPAAALPGSYQLASGSPSRFTAGLVDDTGGQDLEGSDGLIVMFSPNDDEAAWLTAGEGLSALWLAATTAGLSVVPLSQVVEVPETREAFRAEVLGSLARPLLVLRIGWQEISRSQLPRTPRRPVDEVLELR